jgi:hypothetical protein
LPPSQRELDLGLEDRKGRAQLVTRVSGEYALTRECGLQTIEHLVKRCSEPGDLIARGRNGQAPIGLGRRNRRGPPAHRIDRPKGRSRHAVACQGRQDQCHGSAPGEQSGERTQ